MPAGMAETRVTEFVQYWTERTQNGKKQKWEMEKKHSNFQKDLQIGSKWEKNLRRTDRHNATKPIQRQFLNYELKILHQKWDGQHARVTLKFSRRSEIREFLITRF